MKPHNKYTNLLQFENLSSYDSLFHFSSTVDGGVSKGNYATFNLGLYSGDNSDDVEVNRGRLAGMIGVDTEDLYFPYQTHEDKICMIDRDFLSKSDLEKYQSLYGIDAVITDQKNICIGVSTADCVPVMLYDPYNKILAAVHAGWRGTVAKITQKSIEKMKEIYASKPQDLIVGIAPSISPVCFEVGSEVVDAFALAGFPMSDISYKNEKTDRMHINLWEANKWLLTDVGVNPDNIEISGLCTYSNPDLFFSARRQTIHSGRMITGGVLR